MIAEAGLLVKEKRGRFNYYLNVPLINLFRSVSENVPSERGTSHP
jgi:hypothetical protein